MMEMMRKIIKSSVINIVKMTARKKNCFYFLIGIIDLIILKTHSFPYANKPVSTDDNDDYVINDDDNDKHIM
jgi:hypothetical protein